MFLHSLRLNVVAACILFSTATLSLPHSNAHSVPTESSSNQTCRNIFSAFDYSAKTLEENSALVCDAQVHFTHFVKRQMQTDDDYTCSESKPCRNGACCPKATGVCNYGEKYCGTNGQSPNDVCWSNCNAKAECGINSDTKDRKCPLNVCCSKFGFCGMEKDFCDKGTKDDPGCQSNCEQPGSGGSNGNVQNRIIGYYEAWAHDRKCQGMNFRDIPVGALTHLYFSFGYITPNNFDVAPMDDLSPDLFTEFTKVKQRNSGLKTVIALGGWTFNDNGTATQPVFSNMVSSSSNRGKFIKNLFAFLREYGFDGVDFDWEYPGAPDRGGHPDDGKNFVTFLKELNDENNKQPEKYSVSFTVPTSFWYLRWFDLKAADYVDFINVMSYDLHGIWDSTNPIGSHVYPHTNLTEIKLALDLFWRNSVKPDKLNLGLGFYGRSFQLSDPTCYKPGCNFKGGASPGGCSQNSGTLTYKEIQDIVKNNKLKPYHDKVAGVKYITWNRDQWVSYDDQETFKQKIDFANKLGLGGLLIWAIDQDTDELDALKAVLAPKTIAAFAKEADDASFWGDATVPDCYVTDCGGTCKAGFFKIADQPCGGAKPVTRHSKEANSLLCCPLDGAPDSSQCRWRGEAPTCNGHCQDDEVTLELNRWGDGKYCEDGNKVYCCDSPGAKENKCYWAGVGKSCNGDDETMTFSGTFLDTLVDIAKLTPLRGSDLVSALDELNMDLEKRYCCPKKDAKNFENCRWYGKPGSCFDNHCPIGHSVQLTDSPYGLGESCFPRLERSRVFCCDPAHGKSPFLPVPLNRLFKDPPTSDNVDTDFTLKLDDTFGSGKAKTGEDPSDAAFQFVVLASPEELQTSLDKRDGSHWELYGCQYTTSEEEQTIQMFCTDTSENSNCHKIGLGHGVPGTILEMPAGCGPGRYAVAKSMEPSKNQTIPPALRKRGLINPVVYDLTFDYDFKRVPRDVGDTQMRIDFSNKNDYWDNVVAAAASKRKAKRSISDVGGNHKRWLEEEWRDDYHFGGLSQEELHKRWFGSDLVAWLTNLVSPKIKKEFTHDIDEEILAKIIDDQVNCGSGNAKFHAHILVQAMTNIKVSTSFGFSLITRLNFDSPDSPLDLSQSYLTFSNNGEITATFRLEALMKVSYDTGDRTIVTLPFPGATFRVPGIVTIGPSVRVVGSFNAGLTLSAEVETKVDIASWDVAQTLPDANNDFDPKLDEPMDTKDSGNPNGLMQPQFYAAVQAEGKVEAHLKAIAEFGIRFDDKWKIGAATAGVAADGFVRFSVAVGNSTDKSCPWTYGLKLGAALIAEVDTPSMFGWGKRTWDLPGSGEVDIIKGGTCPDLRAGSPDKRGVSIISSGSQYEHYGISSTDMVSSNFSRRALSKRATPWGPPFHLPLQAMFCPNANSGSSNEGTECEKLSGWSKRSVSLETRDAGDLSTLHRFEKRARKDPITFCKGGGRMTIRAPPYDGADSSYYTNVPNSLVFGYTNRAVCTDFGFGQLQHEPVELFDTEHVLEFQLIPIFLDEINSAVQCPNPDPNKLGQPTDLCHCMKPLWDISATHWPAGVTMNPIDQIVSELPGSNNQWRSEQLLLEKDVNQRAKQGMWGDDPINNDFTMQEYLGAQPDKAFKNIKDVISVLRYHMDATVAQRLIDQKNRVGNMMNRLDTVLIPQVQVSGRGGNFGRWQAVGLQNRWNTWIRGRANKARVKAETYIETYLERLKDGYASEVQRQVARDGDPSDPLIIAARTLIAKIDALDNEWQNNRPRWQNPF